MFGRAPEHAWRMFSQQGALRHREGNRLGTQDPAHRSVLKQMRGREIGPGQSHSRDREWPCRITVVHTTNTAMPPACRWQAASERDPTKRIYYRGRWCGDSRVGGWECGGGRVVEARATLQLVEARGNDRRETVRGHVQHTQSFGASAASFTLPVQFNRGSWASLWKVSHSPTVGQITDGVPNC